MTSDSEEEAEPRLELDRLLDQSLETKSRHHKLTAVNVKNILHVSLHHPTPPYTTPTPPPYTTSTPPYTNRK